MKSLLLILAGVMSVAAFGADAPKKKYIDHFVIPVVDSRINFQFCIVEGAYIGIVEGKMGNVVCMGPLKADTSKNPKTYYIYKAEGAKTQQYFAETGSKNISAAGGEEGGERKWSVSLEEVDSNLNQVPHAHDATLKFDETWEYSDGGTTVSGALPSVGKFGGSMVQLDTIDEELKTFISQIQ